MGDHRAIGDQPQGGLAQGIPATARKEAWILLGLFAITLAVRLVLAFQTPYFTDDDSYFWVRQSESIIQTGTHFTHDPLSWRGRELSFSPLFAYIIAFAGLFGPLEISAKILLNAIAASATIFIYLTSLHLTGSRHVASLSAIIGATTPLFISATATSLSPFSIIIPLIAILTYAYLRVESKAHTRAYLICLVTLSFLTPVSVVFIIGLLVYLLLTHIEHIPLRKEEPEIILFSVFFAVWAALVQYKKPILAHGAGFIWQNIPPPILHSYFTDVNILSTIATIGLVPFAASVFITYRYLLQKQSIQATILISQAIATGALLWLELLKPIIGYILLGLTLSLIFSMGYQTFLSWLSQTRFGTTHTFATLIVFLLIVSTSLIPSLVSSMLASEGSGMESSIPALEWLGEHSAPNATVLGDIDEGNIITTFAKRPVFIDSNFLLAPDARERHEDFQQITATPVTSTAIDILSKYDIQYVFRSPKLNSRIQTTATWIADTKCLTPLYNKTVIIYQVTCQLQTI